MRILIPIRLTSSLFSLLLLLGAYQCANPLETQSSTAQFLVVTGKDVPTDLSWMWQKQYLDARYTQEVGKVALNEDGLWVADALLPKLAGFFPAKIPSGSFPLIMHLDTYAEGYEIEGVSIKFSDAPVNRWKRARSKTGLTGVWSDTGLLTYLSSSQLAKWKQELPSQTSPTYVGSLLEKAIGATQYLGQPADWCSLSSVEHDSLIYPIAGTGVGDGYFSAYWGLKGNEVVAFTLQFAPSKQPEKMVMAQHE